MARSRSDGAGIGDRIAALDWAAIDSALDARGHATTGPLLTPGECAGLAALYPDERRFRRTVVMQRHGYGTHPQEGGDLAVSIE